MNFRLTVRVNPNTSRQRAVWKGEFLKVNLTSPPEDGRANEELEAYLADLFDLKRSQVELDRGHAATDKELLLCNVDREHVLNQITELKG